MDFELPPLTPSPDPGRLPEHVAAGLTELARICRDTGLLREQVRLVSHRTEIDADDAGTELVEAAARQRYRAVLELSDTVEWMLIDAAAAFTSNVTRTTLAVLRVRTPEAVRADLDSVGLLQPDAMPLVQFGNDRDADLRRTHDAATDVLTALAESGDPATLLSEKRPIGDPWLLDLADAVHDYGHSCAYALSWYLKPA